LTSLQDKLKNLQSQNEVLHNKVHVLERDKEEIKRWSEQLEVSSQNVQELLKEKCDDLSTLQQKMETLQKDFINLEEAKRLADAKLQQESEYRLRAEIATDYAYNDIQDLQSCMQQTKAELERVSRGNKQMESDLEHERADKMKAEDLLKELQSKPSNLQQLKEELKIEPLEQGRILPIETLVLRLVRARSLCTYETLKCKVLRVDRDSEGTDKKYCAQTELDPDAIVECPINRTTVGIEIGVCTPTEMLGSVIIPASEFEGSKEETEYPLQRKSDSDQVQGDILVKLERYQSIQDEDTF